MFKRIKEFILRTSTIRRLEKENTELRNSIIRATDLVSDYRDAMREMQSFLNIMAQREMGQNRMGVDENPFGDLFESEEEGDFDEIQTLRKKNLLN